MLMLIAFISAIGVILTTILTSQASPTAYVDYHGMLVVLGGTAACAAIAYQPDRILLMLKVFFQRMLKGRKPRYAETIKELMVLAEAYRKSEEELKATAEKSKDPFIKECVQMLTDNLVDRDHLRRMLSKRVKSLYERYIGDAEMFKKLGKYPPAMGLMGAVIGMIALLRGLGQEGAESAVGPAMSIALVATFYGIAFANLIILPIGDNLEESSKQIMKKNQIIVEGIILIFEKTNPIILAEELNSFLLPSERIDWRKDPKRMSKAA